MTRVHTGPENLRESGSAVIYSPFGRTCSIEFATIDRARGKSLFGQPGPTTTYRLEQHATTGSTFTIRRVDWVDTRNRTVHWPPHERTIWSSC